MLSRRNLRIKVMQTLFAHQMDPNDPLDTSLNALSKRINASSQLYLLIVTYLIEIAEYTLLYAAKKSGKRIVKEEDKNISKIFASNPLIIILKEDEELNKLMDQELIESMVDRTLVVQLFNKFIKTEAYLNYIKSEEHSLEDEKLIILALLDKLLKNDEDFLQNLEGHFINYFDDFHMVAFQIHKAIEGFKGKANIFLQSVQTHEEDSNFAALLLEKTIDHDHEFTALIEPKLQNWELDRIANVDVILMKMAICELKYFPTIPIKVSINEYIDLSKQYSTPKSREFINGVLDKIMNELRDSGDINKVGRGLIEK